MLTREQNQHVASIRISVVTLRLIAREWRNSTPEQQRKAEHLLRQASCLEDTAKFCIESFSK